MQACHAAQLLCALLFRQAHVVQEAFATLLQHISLVHRFAGYCLPQGKAERLAACRLALEPSPPIHAFGAATEFECGFWRVSPQTCTVLPGICALGRW